MNAGTATTWITSPRGRCLALVGAMMLSACSRADLSGGDTAPADASGDWAASDLSVGEDRMDALEMAASDASAIHPADASDASTDIDWLDSSDRTALVDSASSSDSASPRDSTSWTDSGQNPDMSIFMDASSFTDASAPMDSSADADTLVSVDPDANDSEASSDGPSVACDPACSGSYRQGCVLQPGGAPGSCIPCLVDGNCTANPYSWGNLCQVSGNDGTCLCYSDADCVGHPHGPVCHPRGTCGCTSDASCAAFPGTVCGISVDADYAPACQPPCHSSLDCGGYACNNGRCVQCLSDSDCLGSANGNRCNPNTGQCVSCTSNSDCAPYANDPDCFLPEGQCVPCFVDAECPAARPHCVATDTFHGCLECRDSLDCANSPHGSHCNADNACDCTGPADCMTPSAEGGACFLQSIPSYCGCVSNADCTGNALGPSCQSGTQECTCSSNADCTVPPYTLCALTTNLPGFTQCSRPCAVDADCAGKPQLPFCNAGTGLCVACRSDGDCTNPLSPHCDPAQGLCVRCVMDSQCPDSDPVCDPSGHCRQCRADSDCAVNRAGGICDTTQGRCTCNSDADCVGNDTLGSQCGASVYGNRCGCGSDAACVGNTHGPMCEIFDGYGSCTCHPGSNADCTTSPYTICAVINTISNASMCKAPCTSDASCDWVDTGFSHCDPVLHMCVGCSTNADCASQTFDQTCSPQRTCEECVVSSDCTLASLGPQCTSNDQCRCLSNADCASNLNGRLCDTSGSFVCHCMTDADCPAPRTCSGAVMPAGTVVTVCR